MKKKIHKRGTPVREKKGPKKTREKGGEHDTLVIETESKKAWYTSDSSHPINLWFRTTEAITLFVPATPVYSTRM